MPNGQPSDANSYLASLNAGSAGPQQVPAGAPPLPLPSNGPVQVTQGPPPQQPLPGYTAPSNPVDDVVVGLGLPGGAAIGAQRVLDTASRMAASGGGYKMDVDQMKALLPRWEEVRDELRKLVQNAIALANVQAPADDQASNGQIQAVERHAKLYTGSIQAQYDYANEYANSLRKAIAGVQGQDESAAEAARRSGRNS